MHHQSDIQQPRTRLHPPSRSKGRGSCHLGPDRSSPDEQSRRDSLASPIHRSSKGRQRPQGTSWSDYAHASDRLPACCLPACPPSDARLEAQATTKAPALAAGAEQPQRSRTMTAMPTQQRPCHPIPHPQLITDRRTNQGLPARCLAGALQSCWAPLVRLHGTPPSLPRFVKCRISQALLAKLKSS